MNQREIKFRAWDNANDVMRDWDYIRTSWTLSILNGDSNTEIMQFTGLKDKNGVEIYEGDIVHYRYDFEGTDNWQIVWGDDSWVMRRGDRETGYNNMYDDPHTNNWKEVEVIGNIYENSELLK